MTVTLKNVDVSLLDKIRQFVSSLQGVEVEENIDVPNAFTEKVLRDCIDGTNMSHIYDDVEVALTELKR